MVYFCMFKRSKNYGDINDPPQGSLLGPGRSAMVGRAEVRLAKLDSGVFTMGSSDGPNNELPLRRIVVSSFEIGIHPVTQAQWAEAMGGEIEKYPSHPKCGVSWFETLEFLNRLSVLESLQPCYSFTAVRVRWHHHHNGYRLPTEAEWEFAARAGSVSRYSFGNNTDSLSDYSWCNRGGDAMPVGQKRPNPWGLYDVHGLVDEWVWDRYDLYSSDILIHDPVGPGGYEPLIEEFPKGVSRGGSYIETPWNVRSSSRTRRTADSSSKYWTTGFRVARGAR